MGKDLKFWAMVLVIGVVMLAAGRLSPKFTEAHKQRVIEQFHLPADVTFLELRSGWSRGNEHIEATLQLTPPQFETFSAQLEDPEVWRFIPFEHDKVRVEAVTEPGWDRWHDGDLSVIVDLDTSPHAAQVRKRERALKNEPRMAIRWVGWGHRHGQPGDPAWSVYKTGRAKTLCWAYAEMNGLAAVRPCTAYPPTGWSPKVYVRAKLDLENRRLFVYIP